MAKLITKVQPNNINNSMCKPDWELVKSMNSPSNIIVNENTKLIIVGTITPPNGNGYYYTSKYNRIYGYIDEALGTELKEMKKRLIEGDKSAIDSIKNCIADKGIAFIDVIESAIRVKSSSKDEDIKCCTLDYKSFEFLQEGTNYTIICNSKDAQECFQKICDHHGICIEPRLLSQRWATKGSWIQAIDIACK